MKGLRTFSAGVVIALLLLAVSVQAEIVISEVMISPLECQDSRGEWFEVYNNSDETIQMTDWTIRDDGIGTFTISGLEVPPHEYRVLVDEIDSLLNGGVVGDSEYHNFAFEDDDDVLKLYNAQDILMDEVWWDVAQGWTNVEGASIYLTDPSLDNNDPANWAVSYEAWTGSWGDFGSPGEANPEPWVAPELVISEIMYDPAAVSDFYGEWFEVYNAGSTTANMRLFSILDNDGEFYAIPGNLVIEPGDFVVLAGWADPDDNGGIVPDFVFYNYAIDLDNTDDEIIITDFWDTVIDVVEYDENDGFPEAEGASIYLPDLDADNMIGANWSVSEEMWSGSAGDLGSPGEGPGGNDQILTLTPHNTAIPATGGTLVFDVTLNSPFGGTFQNVFFRTLVELPNGTVMETGTQYFTLTPFMQITVPNRTQPIPNYAPAGEYIFFGQVGYPTNYVEDSFTFTKAAPLLAGTGSTADWATDEPFLADAVDGEAAMVPERYTLNAAWPNPFNAATTLTITLPETSELTVMVYNVAGQQVAQLADGSFNAGTHELTFDASGLASGLYFIRATAPGRMTQTQKVMLVR
ncbi:lamin tail domain-containing protein [bacterium]|nr:lamin tail domain-containing protein [bacterium]